MNKFQRVKSIIAALLILACCLVLIIEPDGGASVIMVILSVSLIVMGVNSVIYFITMARHMVGGRSVLYKGLIILDIGIFTLTIVDTSIVYIIAYLLAFYVFTGVVDVLRAMEAKRFQSPTWKAKLVFGLLNIAAGICALVCGIVFRSARIVVYIYSAGLVYSACSRIASAFKRTTITYVS